MSTLPFGAHSSESGQGPPEVTAAISLVTKSDFSHAGIAREKGHAEIRDVRIIEEFHWQRFRRLWWPEQRRSILDIIPAAVDD